MIKLKDDVRCIQFTDNSFDEIVELLGDKYMGFRTNPIVNKGSIMFSNVTLSPAFSEIIEGDYILVSPTKDLLVVFDEEYFSKIFEVEWYELH